MKGKIMDYKTQLATIEKTVQDQKLEKAKLEQRQKTLLEEKQQLLDDLTELGIEEKDLEAWLKNQETEIDKKIKKVQELLGIQNA